MSASPAVRRCSPAEALVARDFRGVVVCDLLGPREETMARVTRVLGAAIEARSR
jgi:hypothetical protein